LSFNCISQKESIIYRNTYLDLTTDIYSYNFLMIFFHGKNNFTVKYLKISLDLKIILLDHQNYYRKLKHDEQCCKKISNQPTWVLHNYFDSSTKLFSDLHLDKFLDISKSIIDEKLYFPVILV